MIAFIVATPLQLFNSMMIMRHHFCNEKCNLFILDIACDMHSYVNMINSDNIESCYYFSKIYSHKSVFHTFWESIHTNEEQKKILAEINKSEYSHLFTTWVGYSSTWIYTRLKKFNPNMKLHFYEEGIGVYIKDIRILAKRTVWLYKMLHMYYDMDFIQDIYMYSPQLCQDMNNLYPHIPIGMISDADRAVVGHSFKDNLSPYTSEIIYFECNFQNSRFSDVDECEIVDFISNALGAGRLVVRTHPRSNPLRYTNKGYCIDRNCDKNWEILMSLQSSLHDLVLISPFSSSIFYPKIMFDQEPRLIIIGKCIKNENPMLQDVEKFWPSNLDTMANALKLSYRDSSRVMIPENYIELKEILNTIATV